MGTSISSQLSAFSFQLVACYSSLTQLHAGNGYPEVRVLRNQVALGPIDMQLTVHVMLLTLSSGPGTVEASPQLRRPTVANS